MSGIVLDKVTRRPIPYAHLVMSGNKATQADSKGAFTLRLLPGERLRITSLGYAPGEFSAEYLHSQSSAGAAVTLFLEPRDQSLQPVVVRAEALRWKARKAGYHIDEGSSFHHAFTPADTLSTAAAGQQIGNRIRVRRKPGVLQSVSFGLAGSGSMPLRVGVRLYTLKDGLPDRDLLPGAAVVAIPPRHTGWVTVDLSQYNLTVEEDFALVIEWLSGGTLLSSGALMAFATLPRGQVTYYRAAGAKSWRTLDSKLLDVKSIGMYATLLYGR